eukprot:TRINITY_DN30375_c0_g1_i1.p1 TRINITY_DN30375_c0_g1~~TRINITY_DN30375_c0_g1_i1.p1  ORF type:complete len:374 (+),score=73.05 TRINITY_DN30375_c0_g1_i1:38-1159(+)
MASASVRIGRGSLDGIVPLDRSAYCLEPAVVDAYLERLGLCRSLARAPTTLETLTTLQAAHVDKITYENISLHCGPNGAPSDLPPLNPQASATRVCEGRRGGYCFLLVDAYAALLCTLGFEVSLHTGGVGANPLPYEKWGNHVVLLVRLDNGRLFVSDVGLGDGPPEPFELREHQWTDRLGYRFALEHRGGGEWRFTHDATGSFDGFSFDVDSSCAGAFEFSKFHRFLWSDPASTFRSSGVVLQRRCCCSSGIGALTLRNCTLFRCHPSIPEVAASLWNGTASGGKKGSVLRVATSAAEWLEIVESFFGLPIAELLSVDERDALWGVISAKQREWRELEAARQRRRWLVAAMVAGVAAVVVRLQLARAGGRRT